MAWPLEAIGAMVADEPLTRPGARRVNGFRQFQLLRYYAAACPENGVGTHSGVVFVFSPYESSRILRICAPLNIARAIPSNIEVILPSHVGAIGVCELGPHVRAGRQLHLRNLPADTQVAAETSARFRALVPRVVLKPPLRIVAPAGEPAQHRDESDASKALIFIDAQWLLRPERGLELADHLRLRARDLAHPEHAAARAGHGPDALDEARAQRLDLLGSQVLADALDHMDPGGEEPRLGPAL